MSETAIDIQTEADGSVVVDLSTRRSPAKQPKRDSVDHDDNLVDFLDDNAIGVISQELLEGIDSDISSRISWVDNYNEGIKMLGLLLEKPSEANKTTSMLRHPLLAWSIVQFQSQANGEMLPSGGPVKIESKGKFSNEIADKIESDYNWYITSTATGYYADTDRGLYYLGYGGSIFKKVYTCPLRDRPVSETVYLTDLIISNNIVDLEQAARVTHVVEVSANKLRQYQDIGYWADVNIDMPVDNKSSTDRAEMAAAGISPSIQLPRDVPHTLYECCCTLDLGRFESAEKGQKEGIELPYRVTIDRDTRQIYEIRRNWREGDDKFIAKRRFIKWGLVPGIGYLDQGFLNLLGNHAMALTAIERVLIDSGIYSVFPGGVRVKGMRQDTNQVRPAPGEFLELDTAGLPINQAVMALPFKGPTAELLSFLQHLEGQAEKMAGAVTVPTDEGTANIPVGTMLAYIEQQAKVMLAIHKRLHNAQSEELQLLRDELVAHPRCMELLCPPGEQPSYTKEQFASSTVRPQSDPNVPAHIHRLMQATAVEQLSQAHPELYDQREVQEYVLHIGHVPQPDIDRMLLPKQQAAAQQMDPQMALVMAQIEIEKQELKLKEMKTIAEVKASQAKTAADTRNAELKTELQAAKDAAEQATKRQKQEDDTTTEQAWVGMEHERQQEELAAKAAETEARLNMEQALAEAEIESREGIAAMQEQTKLIIEDKRIDAEPASDDPVGDKKSGP